MQIKLTQGRYATVDDKDYEWVNQFKWQFDSHGYASRRDWTNWKTGGTKIYMHRLVMKNSEEKEVDHINGDGLDCRKSNLRFVTHSQNMLNRTMKNSNNTSGVRGIHFDKARNKWRASIKINYKSFMIGRYPTIYQAIHAYGYANY